VSLLKLSCLESALNSMRTVSLYGFCSWVPLKTQSMTLPVGRSATWSWVSPVLVTENQWYLRVFGS